ncbi:ERCC4-type nuclease [Desulfovibrio sp. DV]|nr:ERCC4-type nuclease [Desulfovibrio sp. DV]
MIRHGAQVANQTVALDTDAEARKEREALAWCNKISRKLDNKRSKTKRQGGGVMRIVIDSREQAPFHFHGYDAEVAPGTLQAGDYSLYGLESLVAVERKSLSDLVACLGRERERFERELERLRGFESAAVVVESPMADLALGQYRSALNPKAAYESVVAFMCRYRLTFYFAQDRRGAERFTYSFLRHFLRTVERRYAAVALTKAHPPSSLVVS